MTDNDIGRLKIKGWSRDMSGKCKQKENKTVFRVIEIKQNNSTLKMFTQLVHEHLLTVKSSNNTELHSSKGKHCYILVLIPLVFSLFIHLLSIFLCCIDSKMYLFLKVPLFSEHLRKENITS